MKTRIKLEQAFELARLFFPEWDQKHEWRIKVDRRRWFGGAYDSGKKIIWLSQWDDEGSFFSLIIHEICHFTRGTHGEGFQNRLKQASDQMREWSELLAEQAGEVDVDLSFCIHRKHLRELTDEESDEVRQVEARRKKLGLIG